MTSEEFFKKHEELLKELHPELATVLAKLAWEEGHACGYEEVLSYLSGYVYSFRKINCLLKGE